jgi:hypothetical protein
VKRTTSGAGCLAALAMVMVACRREPRDYDDCILRYVKAGMNEAVAAAVTRSCRQKFPTEISTTERDFTAAEVAALTGRASLSHGTLYAGTVYNGNANLTVTQLRIVVTMTTVKGVDFDTMKTVGGQTPRSYSVDVSVPPQTVRDFSFNIIGGDEGASYTWSIVGARGKPVK